MNTAKLGWSIPAALLALGIATIPASAQQSATLTFLETGGNVVGTWSGAFDLTGLPAPAGPNPSPPSVLMNMAGSGVLAVTGSGTYSAFSALASYNLGASTAAATSLFAGPSGGPPSSSSGAIVGAVINFGSPAPVQLFVPVGYTTGTALTSSATWNAQTLAGMKLNAGSYVWNYGTNNSSVKIQVGPAPVAVPEPGEWAAMGILGAGLTGLVLRKRKQA